MTTALVTGGSGYFGALLATQLRAAGQQVRILDLNRPDDAIGLDFLQGDIRDAATVRAAVEDVDVVYHNVAQVPLAKDEHLLRTVNVDGTRILLAACRGGINSLMAEVLEDHILEHVAKGKPSPEIADDLIDLVRAYLK